AFEPRLPELERFDRVYINMPDPATYAKARAPEVLQSRVSGITARLKDFKKGGADADAPAAASAPVSGSVSLKGLDRLQALRGRGAAAASSPAASEDDAAPPANAPDRSALGGEETALPEAPRESPASAASGEASPESGAKRGASAATRKKSGADAVSKLKKVAGGALAAKKGKAAPEKTEDELAARIAKANDATALAAPKKLNQSASRLSAFRKPPGS
ncbi:MAG: hypothetical protein L0Z55_10070, partial [Planctomycetes bacterium]|nr:hypothetical protein [Planctomycetota bacterium]